MLRNSNLLRLFGNLFVLFIVGYMTFMYYIFIYVNLLSIEPKTNEIIAFLILFHCFYILVIISFIQTILSDPGRVPLYWGFFLDDPDHKRRRYCLICHIFKPERCHHCSACNRCVLNMDHHCPWLNNCIGFYNRKFFLLLIFYVILCKGLIALYFLLNSIYTILEIIDKGLDTPFFPGPLTLIAYIINCILLCVMSFFFSFHVRLVITNMTTIEHMERRRTNDVTNYDMGFYYNFVQIFGKNPYLWLFPVFLKTGKPIGDGVVWPQRPSNQIVEKHDQNQNPPTEQRSLERSERPAASTVENRTPNTGGVVSSQRVELVTMSSPNAINNSLNQVPNANIQRVYPPTQYPASVQATTDIRATPSLIPENNNNQPLQRNYVAYSNNMPRY